MAQLRVLAVLQLTIIVGVASFEQCIQGENCKLPVCSCPSLKHPLGPKSIPQIVYFAFDDAVNPMVSEYYKYLFPPNRLNPNGCPVTFTLYVSHEYTDYSLVNYFFQKQHEIGDHSVSHTFVNTEEKLREEAGEQRQNLELLAGIPATDIDGWRSPYLATAGDAQPRVLKDLNFTYDISLTYVDDGTHGKIPFPYTLDFGYPYPCKVPPCPGKDTRHKGFWEVPVVALHYENTPCPFVDSCRPKTQDDAFDFLLANFNRSYHNEKAPFGLNMHAAWFYSPEYLRATERFIKTVLKYDDVYIVSVNKMLAWMKNPKTLHDIKSFEPWQCLHIEHDKGIPFQNQFHPPADKRMYNLWPDAADSKPTSDQNPVYKWIMRHKP